MSTKIRVFCSMMIIAVVLIISALPAQAAPAAPAGCTRTAAGMVCPSPQAPAGGSGITPVKRFKN